MSAATRVPDHCRAFGNLLTRATVRAWWGSGTGWELRRHSWRWLDALIASTARVSICLTDMASRVGVTVDAASTDPEVGLRAVASLRALTERLEDLQVDNARKLGWSRHDIGDRLGVTKQTVHRKHGKRVGSRGCSGIGPGPLVPLA